MVVAGGDYVHFVVEYGGKFEKCRVTETTLLNRERVSRKAAGHAQLIACKAPSRDRTSRSLAVKGGGEMTMRVLLILVAISFSAAAFAQSAPPKVGNKPLVQVKPKGPTGCKLVGTVKGTKLWAGDRVGSELRGTTPATETQILA
jgi:hypothetical protein